jgi:hypothetical protein
MISSTPFGLPVFASTFYATLRWFEHLLVELPVKLWIGDAAEIGTRRVRKQTDRQDAQLILCLLLEDRFPRSPLSASKLPRNLHP